MTLLFTLMTWLAPLGLIIVWQWSLWSQQKPEVQFSDWLRADPYICGLAIAQALIVILPLGIWLIMFIFFLSIFVSYIISEQQRIEWNQRKTVRSVALFLLVSIHLMAGFLPVSEPNSDDIWGPPLIENSENNQLWPASEQDVWLLDDGTIIVETHMHTPGILNPWFSSTMANEYSQASGVKEARFQEAAALMDDWIGPNSFTLSPIHDGVMHDYDGENLLYTHDDVMLDLLGMHPSGEMITVWKPTWGGEMHFLTIIKVGPDPFVGNPGAQKYVIDWLS
tara:strand:- start:3520 stop:4359 length:840 start_codon:yes stop_codon:yes gene_type:complete